MVSCKKFDSNDFLRRHYPHQVKGSKLITSSQPAFTSSPVFNYIHNITLITFKFQVNSQKSLNCYWKCCGKQELAPGIKSLPLAISTVHGGTCLLNYCIDLGLYSKELVAIDGTKLEASASKLRHYSRNEVYIL